MIIAFVECYLDKTLFDFVFSGYKDIKIYHQMGKGKIIHDIENLVNIRNYKILGILDYDIKSPFSIDIPKRFKEKFKMEKIYEDNKIFVYKSKDKDISIVLLNPDIEGLLKSFNIDFDERITHTSDIKILSNIIEENKNKIEIIKKYIFEILSKNNII